MTGNSNGIERQLAQIERDMGEIKDELASAIDRLSLSVDNLADRFQSFITVAQNSIPIKAVFWLMGIMVLGLIGVEGIKNVGPIIKMLFGIP